MLTPRSWTSRRASTVAEVVVQVVEVEVVWVVLIVSFPSVERLRRRGSILSSTVSLRLDNDITWLP